MADLTGAAGFESDDGSVPEAVASVLAARERGEAGIRDVVTSLGEHRVLVPLIEVAGDELATDGSDSCAGSDRAVAAVSIQGSDGRPAGLVFTGMAPMGRWDAAARPLPVAARRAAGSVLAEGGRALIIDPGAPHPVRIEGVALARLAAGKPWPDPWVDPAVRAAVVAELGPVLASGEVQVRLSEPPAGHAAGLLMEVRFTGRLPAPVVRQRVDVLVGRLANSRDLQQVFDGVLAVQVV